MANPRNSVSVGAKTVYVLSKSVIILWLCIVFYYFILFFNLCTKYKFH